MKLNPDDIFEDFCPPKELILTQDELELFKNEKDSLKGTHDSYFSEIEIHDYDFDEKSGETINESKIYGTYKYGSYGEGECEEFNGDIIFDRKTKKFEYN